MSQVRSIAVIAVIVLAICGAVWAAKPGAKSAAEPETREIAGIWLLEFEGSHFFEGATPETVRDFDQADSGWLDTGVAIDLDEVIEDYDENAGCWKVRAFALRFKGQRHFGLSGHMGGWNSYYEVAKLSEMKPLSWPECESPFLWRTED